MEELEIKDEEEFPVQEEEGTVVAGGKHVVPPGVAVEELDGGKKKLVNECPASVQDVLFHHGLVETYNKLVTAISENGKTRGFFGGWKDKEFESVLELFKEDFAEKGVKVALCKRKSGSGARRWIEFIDLNVAKGYVPQFDVGNMSGQYIKTCDAKLKFPNGVAVEEIKRYGKARQKLKEKCPIFVEKMLEPKGLMPVYDSFVNELAECPSGSVFQQWNTTKLVEISEAFKPLFQDKKVDLFLSRKAEFVSHGTSGHKEIFRWIEFVDLDVIPNYVPQYQAKKGGECTVM